MTGYLLAVLAHTGHLLVALTFGWLVLVGYRWIHRRSRAIGVLVGLTVLVRVGLGLTLFWISYLNLPIAEGLQLGNGFWQPALDATGYFQLASNSVASGQWASLDHAVPAPLYVNALALWMWAVGVSPAAGMFLNLCLYVTLAVLVVWWFDPVDDWRRDLPCLVGLAAYSAAPVILINSTQPLKDELSNLFIALGCFGVLALRRPMTGLPSVSMRSIAATATLLALAAFGLAAIRWYTAFLLLAAVLPVLVVCGVKGRTMTVRRYAAASALVMLLALAGFWLGAGPYAGMLLLTRADVNGTRASESTMLTTVREWILLPFFWVERVGLARTGFLMSGGDSNVIVDLGDEPASGSPLPGEATGGGRPTAPSSPSGSPLPREATGGVLPTAPSSPLGQAALGSEYGRFTERTYAMRAIPQTPGEHVEVVAAGLAILLLPTTLLEWISNVEIPGRGGLLLIADIDTVLLDVSFVLVLTMLWTRRGAIGDRLPFVLFGLLLSGATAVLLGYVVTNYGTLWRMRPLAAIPLWLLIVALSPARTAPEMPAEASVSRAVPVAAP